jgi:hypothetical protein
MLKNAYNWNKVNEMGWQIYINSLIKEKKLGATHVKGLFGNFFVTWLLNKRNYEKKSVLVQNWVILLKFWKTLPKFWNHKTENKTWLHTYSHFYFYFWISLHKWAIIWDFYYHFASSTHLWEIQLYWFINYINISSLVVPHWDLVFKPI